MNSRLNVVALFLSIVGAAVDFSSGTIMLQNAMVSSSKSMMGNTIDIGAVVWGLLLYGLATVLVITGVLGTTRVADGKMPVFGGLMVAYGAVMLVIGSVMFIGITPVMQDILASTLAMFAVGLSMLLNGMVMTIGSRSIPVKQEM
ncbi:MAG: hypothetical protein A3K61_03785 [Thaumarchaeota archaeon RBG_16_49_8]|nr:MAG: hypothetical protein A3K61_03785 [Thaumarchaeota archaeon RBG_16_49_8]